MQIFNHNTRPNINDSKKLMIANNILNKEMIYINGMRVMGLIRDTESAPLGRVLCISQILVSFLVF